MDVCTAPTDCNGAMPEKSLFMAGGISGCPDWQTEFIERLKDNDGLLFNPRRANFDINDPSAAEIQIQWEHYHLRRARAVSFWFPHETLCPIVLFELGAWSMTDKPIFVGCHPLYKRRYDVVMQLKLSRPKVRVVQSLVELTSQIKRWVTS